MYSNENYNLEVIQSDYTVCQKSWGMINEVSLFYRVYYICGGEGFYDEGEGIKKLHKGYVYIFPTKMPYTLMHNFHNPLEVIWAHIEIPTDSFSKVKQIKVEENTSVYFLLQSIGCLAKEGGYRGDMQYLFKLVLVQISNVIDLGTLIVKHIPGVQEYIERHKMEALSVSGMSEFVGMERSYFSRLFRKNYKMSPEQYIISKKMSIAAKYLREGCSILETSKLSGYNSDKAFSRAFLQHMETTPSNYKKSHNLQP